MSVLYIDVSHYDWDRNKGNLDWQQLHNGGIDVAFIRATYGDPKTYNPQTRYFREMAIAAREAGLRVGGYHNLINGDLASIQRQVQYFRAELNAVGAEYAMLDIEPYPALRDNGLWPRLADAELFSQEFSYQDTDRKLTIYLAQWVWSGWLNRGDLRSLMDSARGPLINANYPLGTEKGTPQALYTKALGDSGRGWVSYGNVTPEIWQFSSNSQVLGASSTTDINAYRGTIFDLDSRLRVTEKDWIPEELQRIVDRLI